MNEKIKSINNPIYVEEPNLAPKMVFFMLKRLSDPKNNDSYPNIDIDVLSYVSMSSLSKELQHQVRQELCLTPSK